MQIFKETDRLILREILPTDIEGLFELDSDIEVHRYLGNRPVKSYEEIFEVISKIRKQYLENGIARWAVVTKNGNDFIGWAGLKLVKDETINQMTNYYDLGYRFIRKYWGKGYGTECAKASLEYGFEELNLEVIYAAAHIDNKGSNKILANVGFELISQFSYDDELNNWYSYRQIDWLGRKPNR